jgi:2-oxoglutarate ferredoxin oxidoreductase subunit alpha
MGSEKLAKGHGEHLEIAVRKHEAMRAEARVETGLLDDADLAVVAYGSPSRFVKYAVRKARAEGLRVGWIRPISLWPFPTEAVAAAAARVRAIAVFELSAGQMIDDVRLAAAGTRVPIVPIGGVSHDSSGFGVGPLLDASEILRRIRAAYPTDPPSPSGTARG